MTKTSNILLSGSEIDKIKDSVPQWSADGQNIRREFKFNNFGEAIIFVNKVAELAERYDHHPDISISYNKVALTLSNHKIGGLSRKDFILAAKIDHIINEDTKLLI